MNIIFTPGQFYNLLFRFERSLISPGTFDCFLNRGLSLYGKPLISLSDGYVLWFRGGCDFCGENEFDKESCLRCGAPLDRQGDYISSSTDSKFLKSLL